MLHPPQSCTCLNMLPTSSCVDALMTASLQTWGAGKRKQRQQAAPAHVPRPGR